MYSMSNPTIIAITVNTTIRISQLLISTTSSPMRNGGNRLLLVDNTQDNNTPKEHLFAKENDTFRKTVPFVFNMLIIVRVLSLFF